MSTLTMTEKKKVACQLKGRYQKAAKKQKGSILAEFIEITGYNKSYAARVLRSAASCPAAGKTRTAKTRPCKYDEAVQAALLFIWKLMDYLCGKRLAPLLPILIDQLRLHDELSLSLAVRSKLLMISSATIDRLLAPVRRKMQLKGRSHTKLGTLLKHQIPIRTFAPWDDAQPGFLEIDLVGHDGGNPRGEFFFTLEATDVATSWTEPVAVRNKAQVHVVAALCPIRERLTFTRGRSGRKNDSCFVEQKNYSVVRNAVGCGRFESSHQQTLLNQLYSQLRLRTNFFQPVMKLVSKTRVGSQVHKTYDTPTTPFQRVLNTTSVKAANKEELRRFYTSLNLVDLARNISAIQAKLARSLT